MKMNVKFTHLDDIHGGGSIEYYNLDVLKINGGLVRVKSNLHGVFEIDFNGGLVYGTIGGQRRKIGIDPVQF